MKNMQMEICLKCSVCGNDQFSAIDESIQDISDADGDVEVKCSDCGKVVTKDELLEENSYIIEANIEDFKNDIMKVIEKDFKKIFK